MASGTTKLTLAGVGDDEAATGAFYWQSTDPIQATLATIDLKGAPFLIGDSYVMGGASNAVINVDNQSTLRYNGSTQAQIDFGVVLLPDQFGGAEIVVDPSADDAGLRLSGGVDFGDGSYDDGERTSIKFLGATTGRYLDLGLGSDSNTVSAWVMTQGAGEIRLSNGSILDMGNLTMFLNSGVALISNYNNSGAKIDANHNPDYSTFTGTGTLTWEGDPFVSGTNIETDEDVTVESSVVTDLQSSNVDVKGTFQLKGGVLFNANPLSIHKLVIDKPSGSVTIDTTTSPLEVDNVEVKEDSEFVILTVFTNFSNFDDSTYTLKNSNWTLGPNATVKFDWASEKIAVISNANVELANGAKFVDENADNLLQTGAGLTLGDQQGPAALIFNDATATVGALTVGTSQSALQLAGSSTVTIPSVAASGNVTIDSASTLVSNVTAGTGATINGTGQITGNFTMNDGELEPAVSTLGCCYLGALNVTGNASLNDGIFWLQIQGPDADQVDQLVVGGTATLAADVEISSRWAQHDSPLFSYSQPIISAGSFSDGAAAFTGQSTSQNLESHRTAVIASTATERRLEITEFDAPTGPTLSTTVPSISTLTNNGTITVNFSGASDNDGGSGLGHYLVLWDHHADQDNSDVPAQRTSGTPAGATSPVLTDGTWYLHLAAVDKEGNVSDTTDIGPFLIDITAPPVPTITSVPTSPTTDTSASLAFTSETGATFMCSIGGSAWAACTSPLALTDLAVGTHSVSVLAVDAAGNQSAPKTAEWTVTATNTTTPVAPKPLVNPPLKTIVLAPGAASRMGTIGRTGRVGVNLPRTIAPGARVTARLFVTAAQARALGLRPARRAKTVVIGVGTLIVPAAGKAKPRPLVLNVRLNKQAKAAFARAAGKGSKLRSVKTTLNLVLSKGKLKAKPINKPFVIRR